MPSRANPPGSSVGAAGLIWPKASVKIAGSRSAVDWVDSDGFPNSGPLGWSGSGALPSPSVLTPEWFKLF